MPSTPPLRFPLQPDRGPKFSSVADVGEVLDATPSAIVVVNMTGSIVLVNQAFEQLTGFDRGDLLGRRIETLLPSDRRQGHAGRRRSYLADPHPRSMGADLGVVCRRKHGVPFEAEVNLGPLQTDQGVFVVCTVRDETARKLTEANLTHRALHDPLTGLANRILLVDRLDQAVRRAGRRDGSIAVLFLDVDQFKQINDSFGHATGDEVLTAIAHRLAACVRPEDTVARFGGDEFVVVAEDIGGAEGAIDLAARLISEVAVPLPPPDGGPLLRIGVSAGVVVARRGDDGATLLGLADEALYRAKRLGGSRFEVSDQGRSASARTIR